MSELVLPPGVEASVVMEAPEEFPPARGRGVIVNETDLDDAVVQTYIEEQSSVLGLSPGNTYQNYVAQGSLLTRPKFRVPQTVIEEILLARDLAERDDDVGAAIGAMTAMAFGDGMQNTHPDEVTLAMFDEASKRSRLVGRLKEMYREWLIAAQVTTGTVMTRESVSFTPMGADRQRTRSMLTPRIAIIPSEQIRVLGNDMFGSAPLAYRPHSGQQEQWLMEFFNPRTSPGRKAEMRQQDPILATLLTEQIEWDNAAEAGVLWAYGDPLDPVQGRFVYLLNPAMVHRTTMPKGQWPHPRPLLTRNFPLLEAKRLLHIMNYTLLEAGANFLVVAKKGTDQRPALPQEIANLRDTLRRATRSGVMVGDHRLDIEIITPKLEELLNTEKHRLLGRKLATAILRLPDFQSADAGSGASVLTDTEIIARVIASDRDDLRRHVEDFIYEGVSRANGDSVQGPASIWFPKIILQGLQFFTQLILGLRDRGDIPRRYAVEAAGFNYDAAVQQRKLEKARGDDKVLTTPPVPFSAPQGSGSGRPAGSGPDNGAPGARPSSEPASPPSSGRPTRGEQSSEEIAVMWDDNDGPIYRAGRATYALLETFLDTRQPGRITQAERRALEEHSITEAGALIVVPVNPDHEIDDLHAIRLEESVSAIIGRRPSDGAVLTRALVFREPRFTRLDAEQTTLRWGFAVPQEA